MISSIPFKKLPGYLMNGKKFRSITKKGVKGEINSGFQIPDSENLRILIPHFRLYTCAVITTGRRAKPQPLNLRL